MSTAPTTSPIVAKSTARNVGAVDILNGVVPDTSV
jgi:hypothetical protein